MATTNNTPQPKKDNTKADIEVKEQLYLTEADFERKQRMKTRDRVNRITRVFGVFAIILLSLSGIFEVFFEMTYFGALFTPTEHKDIWLDMNSLNIFDDWLQLENPWLGKLGITVLIIFAAVLLVYFLTYTVVDVVDSFKGLIEIGKDVTKDLTGNVKTTMNIETPEKTETKKKTTKKSLFDREEMAKEPKEKKERKPRRSESNNTYADLTQEQIDALLSGKPMDEVLNQEKDYTIDL